MSRFGIEAEIVIEWVQVGTVAGTAGTVACTLVGTRQPCRAA